MDELRKLFEDVINENLERLVLASVRRKSQEYKKAALRPVMLKGEVSYQLELFSDKKAFHKNLTAREAASECGRLMADCFKQANIFAAGEEIQVLANKAESPRITRKAANAAGKSGGKNVNAGAIGGVGGAPRILPHDRAKKYIIPDGVPCDFLMELGVMDRDGKVAARHYGKFRQINRYLEIVSDCMDHLPESPDGRPLRIIDFGCGKAYLTFALYYYLKVLQGRSVEITGLDLKQDVIGFCSGIAAKLGYDELRFHVGDIAEWSAEGADVVVTLHACDTATDYALRSAVNWNAKVILSVPCCQHELFTQIKNEDHAGLYKHGILKDRFTEILTDGLRGLALESRGYQVSMIEFTSLEHTARNIMLKALLTDPARKPAGIKKAEDQYKALCKLYNVKPTTDIILNTR